jgi:WW domain-containing oxidoreductase
MSLLSLFKTHGPSGFGYQSTAEDVTAGLSLNSRTILITGCNSGLGLEAMRVLSLRGAHVIGAARTVAKAAEACASVGGHATPVACDLAEPASVRACIANVRQRAPLDAIIANAGIMAPPRLKQACGYELQFFTNHIGHFMLVTGLLDRLADQGRVVALSSSAHRYAPTGGIQFDNLSGDKGYSPWRAYGQSKLANLLFAKELARRLAGTGKTANAVHPGVIKTNLFRSIGIPAPAFDAVARLFFKTIPQGAATECYVAVSPGAAGLSGEYLADCNVARPRAEASDPALAKHLWEISEQIVARLA